MLMAQWSSSGRRYGIGVNYRCGGSVGIVRQVGGTHRLSVSRLLIQAHQHEIAGRWYAYRLLNTSWVPPSAAPGVALADDRDVVNVFQIPLQ